MLHCPKMTAAFIGLTACWGAPAYTQSAQKTEPTIFLGASELRPFFSLKPGDPALELSFTNSDPSFRLLQQDHILLADWHKIVRLTVVQPGSYRVEVSSDHAELAAVILDRTAQVLAVLESAAKRRLRKVKEIDLKPEVEYFLVIGTSQAEKSIPFRVGLLQPRQPGLGVDPMRKYRMISKEASFHQDLKQDAEQFGGGSAHFYRLDDRTLRGKWVRIVVNSAAFYPRLYPLDRSDNTVEMRDLAKSWYAAEFVIDPNTEVDMVAVFADPVPSKEAKALEYSLSVEGFDWNPRPIWLARIRQPFSDPSLSFLAGLFVSILLSYFFYLKSIRSKRLFYHVKADLTVIDDRIGAVPLLYSGDDAGAQHTPLYCASLYRFAVWNGGHSEVSSAATNEDLRIHLRNVKAIRSLRSEKVDKSGWGNPSAVEGTSTIRIPFSIIRQRDEITVTALCEQEQSQLIEFHAEPLRGVAISEHLALYFSTINVLMAFFLVIILTGGAYMLASSILGFRPGPIMSAWLDFFFGSYAAAGIGFVLLIMLHPQWRRAVRVTLRYFFWDSVARLVGRMRGRT